MVLHKLVSKNQNNAVTKEKNGELVEVERQYTPNAFKDLHQCHEAILHFEIVRQVIDFQLSNLVTFAFRLLIVNQPFAEQVIKMA